MAYHANCSLSKPPPLIGLPRGWLPTTIAGCIARRFCRRKHGNEKEQVKFLRQTVRLKPDHVPALLRLADGEFKQDRLDEAAHYYERAAGAPDGRSSLQAAFGLGRVAARRHEWNKVIEYVAPLTHTYPYLQPPYGLLVEAYDALGQAKKAAEARQSITLGKSKTVPPPQDPLNDQLIGLSYNSTRLLKQAGLLSRFGYPDQAVQVARRAAEADPKDPDIRNFIARTLLTAYPNKPEAIDEALTQIGEYLRLKPDDPAALWGFTDLFFEAPKPPAAVERLSALLLPFAGRDDAHFFLGMVADARGQVGEAAAQYESALKNNPNNGPLYFKLGLVYDKEGKFDQSIAYFQKATRLEPMNTVAHFNLGVALLQRGSYSQGLREMEDVLRFQPHDAPAHFCMGFAYLYSKRIQEAIASFSDGLRYKPDDAEAHYGLGSALSMQRRREDAVAALREAIRLRPNYPEAQALLQQLER